MNFLIKNIIQLSGKNIIFPFYHLISDDTCPHIRHLYPVKSIDQFKKELDFFQKHYDPITLKEIIFHLKNNTKADKPSFFLSFDDGLKECFTIIAPLLKEKNLSAAFFINSAFVDNQDLFYRYKISLLIESLKNNNSDFNREKLLQLTYSDTIKIDILAKENNLDFDLFLKKDRPYMNWSEIEDLKNQGFYIGAHSVDHPLYSQLSLEEQIQQTQQSLKLIHEKLSLKYKIFSFPFTDNGVSNQFFEWLFEEEKVDLSFGTAGIKDDRFPFHLQRLPMDNNLGSPKYFALKNHLAYGLKRMFGKHLVNRKLKFHSK